MHSLGLADDSSTPVKGEALRDFFVRTGDHWLQQVSLDNDVFLSGKVSGKELRTQAFSHCEAWYQTMKPLLDKLDAMEAEQRKLEAIAVASSGKELMKKKELTREQKKELKKQRKKAEKQGKA